MRIAITGAGSTGLAAARLLGEDPRHTITVLERRAQLDAGAELDSLERLGVTLRCGAHVERLAVGDGGVAVWINEAAERFDLALVTTAPAGAGTFLAAAGVKSEIGSTPLGERVYFSEPGAADPERAAREALLRIAADHPGVRRPATPPRDARVTGAFRSLASRLGGRVEYLDLSGRSWPLGVPAVYAVNRGWILDALAHHLRVRDLRTATGRPDATAALDAGRSVAFVVEEPAVPHGHGAALAALAVNALIVPVAAADRPAHSRAKVPVVIGEPFYPETSAVDELLHDIRMTLRYLERLATEHPGRRGSAGRAGTLSSTLPHL